MEKLTVTEQTTREDLVAALGTYETKIEELEKQLADQTATVDNLVAEATKEAEATIEDLKAQLASANVKADAVTETVKHKGTEYRIAAPKFNLDGEILTASHLKKDDSDNELHA